MDLKPVGIFEGFSPGDLKRVSKQMREIKHAQGAEIMIRGEGGVGFLVILDGEAEVATPDGRHRNLGPGDHLGDMALLDHQGRSASVTARTDLLLAAVRAWGLKPCLWDHPDVTYRQLATLSARRVQ